MLCLWAVAAAAASVAQGRNAIEMDFFRAMNGAKVGVFTLEDNDLASLIGTLKYVHTEVLAEHLIGPPARTSRKYGIDVIARSRFSVLNPSSLLSPTSGLVRNVDFGPFVTFDSGVATNTGQLEHIKRYGGYVGVQHQWDVRFAYDDPYYWFSVNGFCPNLPWWEKGTPEAPNPDCLLSDEGWLVRGGLCSRSVSSLNDPGSPPQPTGDKNCTYSYSPAGVVQLDVLAGITKEDCGGRTCTDWLDFRQNCSNTSYRFVFSAGMGKVVPFPYCVEYDINPACEANCEAAACLALPPESRELGLPFWRGRCSAHWNAWRGEQLAAAFGIPGAVTEHALATHPRAEDGERCAYPGGICHPNPLSGGMYCSRAWAGVCQPCWVPGTLAPYPATYQPLCPYDILRSADYRQLPLGPPMCRSTRPRDLCCLYLSPPSCDPAPGAPELPLDEDGFALVAFRQNTTEMAAFLTRVALEKLGASITDPAGFQRFAYWQWSPAPKKGRSLSAIEVAMAPFLAGAEDGNATTTAADKANTAAASRTAFTALPASLRGAKGM